VVGLIWTALWMFLISDTPATQKGISYDERKYIESSIFQHSVPNPTKQSAPWGHIFRSAPFWALMCSHIGSDWGLYTMLTQLPTYMSSVLKFDIGQNGLVSALPYLSMWIFSMFTNFLADFLRQKGVLTTTGTRKLMNSLGSVFPCLAMIAITYTGCDRLVSILLIVVAVGFTGAFYSGYMVNHIDLSTNYSGSMMGMTNFFANMTGVVVPALVGVIVTDNENLSEWRIVFYITAAVYVSTNGVYLIFGSGEQQPWNSPTAGPDDEELKRHLNPGTQMDDIVLNKQNNKV